MELKVYNQNGEEAGKVKLDDNIFGVPKNDELIHQVINSMQANMRTNVAHAKTRAEVSGGGKKPWRQKGTGRARHGSSRSPIWIGGGATHGPLSEKNYSKKINKKMKKKALYVALSGKLKDNEIIILDEIKLKEPKTKEAQRVLRNLSKIEGCENLATKRKNRAIVMTKSKDENVRRSFNNLPGVLIGEARNLNPLDTLTFKYLIFTKESLESLSSLK